MKIPTTIVSVGVLASMALSGVVHAGPQSQQRSSPPAVDGGVRRIPVTDFERCMMLECPKEKKP